LIFSRPIEFIATYSKQDWAGIIKGGASFAPFISTLDDSCTILYAFIAMNSVEGLKLAA